MTTCSNSRNSGSGVTALALILIGAGVFLLLDNLGILWIDRVRDLWPLTLIAIGLVELLRWSRQREPESQSRLRD